MVPNSDFEWSNAALPSFPCSQTLKVASLTFIPECTSLLRSAELMQEADCSIRSQERQSSWSLPRLQTMLKHVRLFCGVNAGVIWCVFAFKMSHSLAFSARADTHTHTRILSRSSTHTSEITWICKQTHQISFSSHFPFNTRRQSFSAFFSTLLFSVKRSALSGSGAAADESGEAADELTCHWLSAPAPNEL